MAKSPNSGIGGILGILVVLLLVGGLAGTPFYLKFLRSDAGALHDESQDSVEAIQRVVLYADEALDLTKFAQLKGDEVADEGSEEESSGESSRAIAKLNDLITKNEAMLKKARSRANSLKSMSHGTARASDQPEVQRIEAILGLLEARLALARAEYSWQLASAKESSARAQSAFLVDAQLMSVKNQTSVPKDAIAAIDAEIAKREQAIEEARENAENLEKIVARDEQTLKSAKQMAAEAGARLSALETQGFSSSSPGSTSGEFEQYKSAYLAASKQLRDAQLAMAILENGTLQGAELSPDADGDMLKGTYEGGTPKLGLFHNRAKLAGARKYLAALEKANKSNENRKEDLERSGSERQKAIESLDATRKRQIAGLEKLAESASADRAAGVAAADEAIAALAKASMSAKATIQAVAKWKSEAAAAIREAGRTTPNPRLQSISTDEGIGAAAQVLAAEIDYLKAVAHFEKLTARAEAFEVASQLAEAGIGSKPADIADEQAEDRKEAAGRLTSAAEAYEKAGKAIQGITVSGGEGGQSISGRNYVWQVQLGQAAVHLLEAQLQEDRDAAFAKQSAAYNILVEAVKDRQQSQLLDQAIETIAYLQKHPK